MRMKQEREMVGGGDKKIQGHGRRGEVEEERWWYKY